MCFYQPDIDGGRAMIPPPGIVQRLRAAHDAFHEHGLSPTQLEDAFAALGILLKWVDHWLGKRAVRWVTGYGALDVHYRIDSEGQAWKWEQGAWRMDSSGPPEGA